MSREIKTTLADLKHNPSERCACKPWGTHETSAIKEYVEMLEAEVAALREHVHLLSSLQSLPGVQWQQSKQLRCTAAEVNEGQIARTVEDKTESSEERTRWKVRII